MNAESPPGVTIYADGGTDVGLGHLSRCFSLQLALEDQDVSTRLLHPPSEKLSSFLREHGGKGHPVEPSVSSILKDLPGSDVLVMDSYRFSSVELEEFRSNVPFLVCFDDIADRTYDVDMVINGNPGAPELNYETATTTVRLLGSDFQILRPEFQRNFERDFEREPENILVLTGGSPSPEMLEVLLDFFDSFLEDFCGIQADIVVGPFGDSITNRNTDNCKILKAPENLVECMTSADLAVSAGGQTLYELSRCGVPTIGYCVGEDQELNLEFLEQKGAIRYIGWLSGDDWRGTLHEELRSLINNERKRSELGNRARELIDGRGSRRVAEHIIRESGL